MNAGSKRQLLLQRQENEFELYGSHVPLLEFIIRETTPKRVLEFGMGKHSTKLFLEHVPFVTSLESNADWFQRCRTEKSQHECILWHNEQLEDYLLKISDQPFDLAFIDGPTAQGRLKAVQRLLGKCPTIVVHDTNEIEQVGGKEALANLGSYFWVEFDALMPHTMTISSNLTLIKSIASFNNDCK